MCIFFVGFGFEKKKYHNHKSFSLHKSCTQINLEMFELNSSISIHFVVIIIIIIVVIESSLFIPSLLALSFDCQPKERERKKKPEGFNDYHQRDPALHCVGGETSANRMFVQTSTCEHIFI